MKIDVCINYKHAGSSTGSATARIRGNHPLISDFNVSKCEDGSISIEFRDDPIEDFIQTEFNKRALLPIVNEYMRLGKLNAEIATEVLY